MKKQRLHLLPAFLAALGAGVATPLAFAPWHAWFVLPAALAVPLSFVIQRRTPLAGFVAGFGYGLGLFAAGVGWIRNAFDAYGESPAWLADGLTGLLITLLALFPAVTLTAAGALLRQHPPKVRDGLMVGSLWILGEWLRSHLAGGFPWLLAGISQTDGPLAPLLPVIGGLGTGLVIAWTAALPALARRHLPGSLTALTLTGLLWALSPLIPQQQWTRPAGSAIGVTLIQPAVAQAEKWDPRLQLDQLDTLMEQIEAAYGQRLIVLPETALPDFQDRLADMLEAIDREARAAGSTVLAGLPWHERGRFHNAVVALGRDHGRYFKRRLVPVGEYTPWRDWWPQLPNPLKRRLPDFQPGAKEQSPLPLGHHRLSVSICYEDAYPELWRREAADADLLVNLSNDAFFASSLASAQHLQLSRARALEQQKPLLRSTNTGISALIDADGRIASRLDGGAGRLEGMVTPRTGTTPFARLGEGPAVLLCLALLLPLMRTGMYGIPIARHSSQP